MANKRTPPRLHAPTVDNAGDAELLALLERLGTRLLQIDAYASAAEEMLDRIPWALPRRHRRDLGRLSHFISDAAESASATIREHEAGLAAVMSGRRKRTRRAQ